MFFVLSKIVWLVIQPLPVVCILLVAGLVAIWAKWRRLSLGLLTAGVAIMAISGLTTIGSVMLSPLEQRFEKPTEPPAHVDGIVVLGGFLDGYVDLGRGGYELNEAGDRIVEALRLAKRYPAARVIVSGGIGQLFVNSEGDAAGAPRFFKAFGLSGPRFEYDGQSKNTWQNAVYSRELAKPKPGETWLLITSAFHMPRAVGCFRKAGFPIVPWPVDYRTREHEAFEVELDDVSGDMAATTLALKEWVGLAAYYMSGRTSALFPAPRN